MALWSIRSQYRVCVLFFLYSTIIAFINCTDQWGIWSGGEGRHGIAMLVVVVTGGYRSRTRYQWRDEGGGGVMFVKKFFLWSM